MMEERQIQFQFQTTLINFEKVIKLTHNCFIMSNFKKENVYLQVVGLHYQ